MAAGILCVDDDRDTCVSLSDVLTDLGYRVDVAYDGPTALELVRRNGYGLAVLDYRMPGMDGLELYRRLAVLRPELVAVFVTAFTADGVGEAALNAGVRRVFSKPINFGDLLPLIEEVVGNAN